MVMPFSLLCVLLFCGRGLASCCFMNVSASPDLFVCSWVTAEASRSCPPRLTELRNSRMNHQEPPMTSRNTPAT